MRGLTPLGCLLQNSFFPALICISLLCANVFAFDLRPQAASNTFCGDFLFVPSSPLNPKELALSLNATYSANPLVLTLPNSATQSPVGSSMALSPCVSMGLTEEISLGFASSVERMSGPNLRDTTPSFGVSKTRAELRFDFWEYFSVIASAQAPTYPDKGYIDSKFYKAGTLAYGRSSVGFGGKLAFNKKEKNYSLGAFVGYFYDPDLKFFTDELPDQSSFGLATAYYPFSSTPVGFKFEFFAERGNQRFFRANFYGLTEIKLGTDQSKALGIGAGMTNVGSERLGVGYEGLLNFTIHFGEAREKVAVESDDVIKKNAPVRTVDAPSTAAAQPSNVPAPIMNKRFLEDFEGSYSAKLKELRERRKQPLPSVEEELQEVDAISRRAREAGGVEK